MIVPSRSTKTAGDSTSLMAAVLSKASDEFISPHSRRSKFAHDNSASVVGNLRCFNGRRAANESKREESNRGVACARDIENLTSLGGNVVRCFVLPKKHHPVFAERDQDILSLPFLEERFTSVLNISVFCWSFIGFAPGNTRSEQRFRAVWFDNCNTAPVDGVSRIGIGSHDFTSPGRLAGNLSH